MFDGVGHVGYRSWEPKLSIIILLQCCVYGSTRGDFAMRVKERGDVSRNGNIVSKVFIFVGCCLATKSLTLNNTKWNGWR